MIQFEQPNPNTLIIDGRAVEFKQKIVKVLSFSDRVIIHLKTGDFEYGDKLVGQNLVAYDSSGDPIWRVEDHGFTTDAGREDKVTFSDEDGRRRVPQSIFHIGMAKDSGMIRATILDLTLTISPETGKIVDMKVRR